MSRNRGTDVLNVTGVSAAPGDYSAPSAPFSLAPGETGRLAVTFSPQSVGGDPGDADAHQQRSGSADTRGAAAREGLVAPSIAATPDSFSVVITGGDSALRRW